MLLFPNTQGYLPPSAHLLAKNRELRKKTADVVLNLQQASYRKKKDSAAWFSPLRMKNSRLVAKDPDEGEQNDEATREETPERKSLDHGLGFRQEATVRQYWVEEGVAQDSLR